jgi:hypothetical protein
MGVGVIPLLWLFRDRTHLLGDGRLWISVLADRSVYHAHEPLAAWCASLITADLRHAGPIAVAERLEWWSVLLGAIALLLTASVAGRVGSDDRGRWVAFLLVAASGIAQFGFGYVEAYPALWVCVLLYLHLALTYADHGRGLPAVGLVLGLAAATHGLGALLAIPTLVLVVMRRPTPLLVLVAIGAALIAPVFAYVLMPQWIPSVTGASAGVGNVAEGSLQLFSGIHLYPHGWGAWLLDQGNRWSLIAPLALPLIAAGLLSGSRGGRETGARRRTILLGTAAVVLMIPALTLDTDGSRGSAVDWDTFAVAGAPLALFAAGLWARPLANGSRLRAPFAAAVALCGVLGLGFVGVNASAGIAADRLELLTHSPTWSDNARGIAYESLAVFHRDRGDTARAADMYLAGTRYQRGNPRLLRNAAIILSWQGRHRESADVYAQLVTVSREDAATWLRFARELDEAGAVDSAGTALRHVLTLDDGNLEAMNQLARILSTHSPTPAARSEAIILLSRSLELRPGQPGAAEIRRTLADLLARGAAPPDSLRK